MSSSGLHLLLEQTSLAEKAQAIAGGPLGVGRDRVAELIQIELTRAAVWKGDIDAHILKRYARGELGAIEVAEHFHGRL